MEGSGEGKIIVKDYQNAQYYGEVNCDGILLSIDYRLSSIAYQWWSEVVRQQKLVNLHNALHTGHQCIVTYQGRAARGASVFNFQPSHLILSYLEGGPEKMRKRCPVLS